MSYNDPFYRQPLMLYRSLLVGERWVMKVAGDPGVGLPIPKTWQCRERTLVVQETPLCGSPGHETMTR